MNIRQRQWYKMRARIQYEISDFQIGFGMIAEAKIHGFTVTDRRNASVELLTLQFHMTQESDATKLKIRIISLFVQSAEDVELIPVVICAFGILSRKLKRRLEEI